MTSSSPTSSLTNQNAGAPADAAPAKLEFRPLDGAFRRGVFHCGEEEIDQWVLKADKRHGRLEARVTTAHFAGNPTPVAFYALASALEDDRALKTAGGRSFFSKAGHFSCVQLQYLAVQRTLQKQGIGPLVTVAAIRDFAHVALKVGVCALTVVALDRRRGDFYKKLGFKEYDCVDGRPKMLMPAQTAIDLLKG